MKSARARILLISFLIAAVGFAYYFTFAENIQNPEYAYYHTLFHDLHFLPLILAGLGSASSWRSTSLASRISCLSSQSCAWTGGRRISEDLELLVYNCVAAALGTVSDREKAREKALRESENLASIGRAVSALAPRHANPSHSDRWVYPPCSRAAEWRG